MAKRVRYLVQVVPHLEERSGTGDWNGGRVFCSKPVPRPQYRYDNVPEDPRRKPPFGIPRRVDHGNGASRLGVVGERHLPEPVHPGGAVHVPVSPDQLCALVGHVV